MAQTTNRSRPDKQVKYRTWNKGGGEVLDYYKIKIGVKIAVTRRLES